MTEPDSDATRTARYVDRQKQRGYKRYVRWVTDKEAEALEFAYREIVAKRPKKE